ncbi:MAG: DNA mismatch repair endonuclease MutL [Verrucomicrobiota bacterium]
MNRIRLLPEQVANQIAAGEVVERPASVVKELVENAIDAQATRITVEIQAGGRSLIRVTDDGFGMSKDDALLCLERHATSKIQRAEDLSAIATMGFRGEALPSIASVSRFTLTTRENSGIQTSSGAVGNGDSLQAEVSQDGGTQIVINGGKILEVKVAGSAAGTSVDVRQLFFNLPARRKFLRSEETEFAHIHHYLTLAALAYPEVAFTFLKDGRVIWQLPAAKIEENHESRSRALRERMRAVMGGELKLLAVDFTGELAAASEILHAENPSPIAGAFSLHLWGFIGAPGVSRSTREDQHLFVNRRPVENRGLNFALIEGYHTALMKGRYPVCCLFLEIGPAEVDVNIHPSKREVKFHHERAVRQRVTEAIRETLLQFHGHPPGANSPAPVERQKPGRVDALGKSFAVNPAPEFSTPTLPEFPLPKKPAIEWPMTPAVQSPLKMGFSSSTSLSAPALSSIHHPPSSAPPHPSPDASRPVPLLSVPLRLVGVIGKLYVVLESDRGLVLIDQHAAHERVLFEQMMRRLEENANAASQRLLLPETIELSAKDGNFLRQQLPSLTRLGVGLSEFGERTFLIDALPPFVKVSEPRSFILELIDELKAAGQGVNTLRLGESTVAKTVCRHAVKANDYLSRTELENLLEDLRRCTMPYTCPHGRPTLIEMNFRELEKKFGRTQ